MPDDLRYPIGPEPEPVALTAQARVAAVDDIRRLPQRIRAAVEGLSDGQLDTAYRPDGWTIRQLVHHVADSHMHAYIRMKLALTADAPRIAPYDQEAWAQLPDSRLPVHVSLALLDSVHARWVALYDSLQEDDYVRRGFFHPERNRLVTLAEQLQTYAWHSRHHTAHVTGLRTRNRW